MERDQITRNIGVDSCPNQTAFVWIFFFYSTQLAIPKIFFSLFLTIGALKMHDGIVFCIFGKRSKARTWRYTLEQSPWKDSARVDGKHLKGKGGFV